MRWPRMSCSPPEWVRECVQFRSGVTKLVIYWHSAENCRLAKTSIQTQVQQGARTGVAG